MALLWIDGFEGYGSSVGGTPAPIGIVNEKYPVVSGEQNLDIETGRYGDYCMEITDYLYYIQTPHLTTNSTLVVGVAFRTSAIAISTREFLWLYEGTNKGINLRINSDGTISVYLDAVLIDTSVSQLSIDTWYYLELKVLTHNSAGTYEVRIDNADWISGTGVDTQPSGNSYHTAVRLGAIFGGAAQYDDLYVLDGSGSENNDFLGNRQVVPLRPNGDGDTNDWTPSTGNNYENVDEVQRDDDTTYNETSTANDVDLYDYADSVGLATINGVMITTCVRVTTGSMDMKTLIKSGATTDESSPVTITQQTYQSKTYLSEQDPNTAAAWTPTNLNAAQFGIEAE